MSVRTCFLQLEFETASPLVFWCFPGRVYPISKEIYIVVLPEPTGSLHMLVVAPKLANCGDGECLVESLAVVFTFGLR